MATCAFAIVKNQDKILLVCIAPPFAEAQKWNFPGGVIENGEDIRDGLVREVYEETNIVCNVLGCIDTFVSDDGVDEISIFNANYKSGEIKTQEEEILDAKWLTATEALELPLAFNIRNYILNL